MSPARLFKGKLENEEQDETDSHGIVVGINLKEDTIAQEEDITADTEPEALPIEEVEEVEVEARLGEELQVGDEDAQDQELRPTLAEAEFDPESEFLVESQQSDPKEIRDDQDESTVSTQIVNRKGEEPEDMESDALMNLSRDAMTTEMMSDFSESQSVDIKASEMILVFSRITDALGGWTRDNA